MPWHLSDQQADCDGWAVVLDEDDSTESCHPDEATAQAHLDELNAAAEPTPPPSPPTQASAPTARTVSVDPAHPAGVDVPHHTITATFPAVTLTAEAGDSEGRTIRGRAVPWNVWGRVSDGTLVRFLPGSLPAEARPVVAMGHDSNRPIGRVSSNVAADGGMDTAVRVSRVRDGDEALVLAQDGVLAQFSVGVNPSEFSFEEIDGEMGMVVAAGEWQHLALVPFGAYQGADVTSVAAAASTQGDTTMPAPAGTVTTGAPPAPVQAGPTPVPISGTPPVQPPLTIGRLAAIIAEGNQGNLRAAAVQARIEAALTDVTSTNVPSPPNYRTELVGLIDHGTPVSQRLESRPLPPTGGEIMYPEWSARPDSTAKVATEKTAIPSGDVAWTWKTNPIDTWAQGNDMSLQAAQRSNPSAMDAYLRAAAIDAGNKYEAATIAALTTASVKPAGATAVFIDNVALMYGSLNPATVPGGRLWLALAFDVAAPLIKITGLNGPALWNAGINFGSFLPDAEASSLDIFVAPGLASKKMLMGLSTGAAMYGGPSSSTDIRVVDVSLLGVDVGVYFFASLAIEYPTAFVSVTSL